MARGVRDDRRVVVEVDAVSYTKLTLPTSGTGEIWGGAGSFKKKKKITQASTMFIKRSIYINQI